MGGHGALMGEVGRWVRFGEWWLSLMGGRVEGIGKVSRIREVEDCATCVGLVELAVYVPGGVH